MEYINIDNSNIENEHICCAISSKDCIIGYENKKKLMKSRFKNGFVFRKLDVNGKVFIEYIPSEFALAPIDIKNYLFISCFWVSGKYKGKAHGKELLQYCENEARKLKKDGIIVISGNKKLPYLTDKKFFIKNNFEVVDTAPPYFELLAKKFNDKNNKLKFLETVKVLENKCSEDVLIYYSNLCPFTEFYTKEIEDYCSQKKITFKKIKNESLEDFRMSPSAFPIYTIFYKGKFLTHEIIQVKKFEILINKTNMGGE